MKIIRYCFVLLLFMAMPLAAQAAQGGSQPVVLNKIAAVVNGEIVTLHELRQHAAAEFMRMGINPSDPAARGQLDAVMSRVLSVMVDDILLRQEAERLKIQVPEADVDNELNMLIKRNQTDRKNFEARVISQGGTMSMVRERIRHTLLSQRIIGIMIARKVVVTPEEISAYFAEHKNDFQAEKSVDISLIVFAPSADSVDVLKRIKSGSLSFAEAAKKYSEGPANEQGGNLGMVKWDDLAPTLKAELVDLQKGQISNIFQVNSQDCLLKLNDATNGRSMTLQEATPEIERILREPRLQQRFTEYTQGLRGRAVIDIRI